MDSLRYASASFLGQLSFDEISFCEVYKHWLSKSVLPNRHPVECVILQMVVGNWAQCAFCEQRRLRMCELRRTRKFGPTKDLAGALTADSNKMY